MDIRLRIRIRCRSMGAIKDLWQSERGLIMVALVAAATTLTGLGIITTDQWLNYTQWLFVTYVTAKTVTGAVAIVKAAPSASPAPDVGAILLDLLAKLAPRPAVAVPEPTAATPPVATRTATTSSGEILVNPLPTTPTPPKET